MQEYMRAVKTCRTTTCENCGQDKALHVAKGAVIGALSKLDASDNHMFGKKDKAGITAWADALKANTSITELNLARNGINANDTKILAPAISDNGALSSLNLSSNKLTGPYGREMDGNIHADTTCVIRTIT